MHFNLTLLGQALTFACFVWFTRRFVWPPLLSAIQKREQTISEGLAAAKQGLEQLARATHQAEIIKAEAKLDAQKIVKAARSQAQKILEEAQKQMRSQTERQLVLTEEHIHQKWQILKTQLGAEVARLTVLSTEEVLKLQSASKQTQRRWISQVIEELS